jgi:hypothetical protein
VIQYSRDISDRSEKPRRTGSPGQALRYAHISKLALAARPIL